ncbi:hypothetical protein KIW84_022257 [Lathyrus oleraceus]|uniref:CAAX prenyl protease 1 homolog n=1 Tax=Pisum sativum TaxID=3888 RepID=A0A9D5B528_PEA|nr:hypothetical protein KIW84_022257 [Pisum sativum]
MLGVVKFKARDRLPRHSEVQALQTLILSVKTRVEIQRLAELFGARFRWEFQQSDGCLHVSFVMRLEKWLVTCTLGNGFNARHVVGIGDRTLPLTYRPARCRGFAGNIVAINSGSLYHDAACFATLQFEVWSTIWIVMTCSHWVKVDYDWFVAHCLVRHDGGLQHGCCYADTSWRVTSNFTSPFRFCFDRSSCWFSDFVGCVAMLKGGKSGKHHGKVICIFQFLSLFLSFVLTQKLPSLPKSLEGVISQEKFEKSRAYSLDESCFHFVHSFVTIVTDSTFLYFKVLPWLWKKSGDFVTLAGLNAENEILHTLGFLVGLMIWSQTTDLPFSLYKNFVIEARHGFNKQTPWLFFRDMIKGIFLSIIIGPRIVVAIIVIIHKGGPYLAIYLWAFMFGISLVMLIFYPIIIASLFNKFDPLPDGPLREKIEKLASFLKFPLKKLFVVDGSTRSSHNNAYMYGFFKNKRIMLYDTLVQKCKNDKEIVVVIVHELGHWLSTCQFGYAIREMVSDLHTRKWLQCKPARCRGFAGNVVAINSGSLYHDAACLASLQFEVWSTIWIVMTCSHWVKVDCDWFVAHCLVRHDGGLRHG